MTSVSSLAATGLMLTLFAVPLFAQSDSVLTEELRGCREHENPTDRLACYDRIGEWTDSARVATPADQPMSPEAQATATVETRSDPGTSRDDQTAAVETDFQVEEDQEDLEELTAEVGLPRPDDDYRTILTTVVRCGAAKNRKFYFYFENGQVWRYLGSKKLRYRNCDGPAKLIEDRLGFKLQLDGDTRQNRVKRIR